MSVADERPTLTQTSAHAISLDQPTFPFWRQFLITHNLPLQAAIKLFQIHSYLKFDNEEMEKLWAEAGSTPEQFWQLAAERGMLQPTAQNLDEEAETSFIPQSAAWLNSWCEVNNIAKEHQSELRALLAQLFENSESNYQEQFLQCVNACGGNTVMERTIELARILRPIISSANFDLSYDYVMQAIRVENKEQEGALVIANAAARIAEFLPRNQQTQDEKAAISQRIQKLFAPVQNNNPEVISAIVDELLSVTKRVTTDETPPEALHASSLAQIGQLIPGQVGETTTQDFNAINNSLILNIFWQNLEKIANIAREGALKLPEIYALIFLSAETTTSIKALSNVIEEKNREAKQLLENLPDPNNDPKILRHATSETIPVLENKPSELKEPIFSESGVMIWRVTNGSGTPRRYFEVPLGSTVTTFTANPTDAVQQYAPGIHTTTPEIDTFLLIQTSESKLRLLHYTDRGAIEFPAGSQFTTSEPICRVMSEMLRAISKWAEAENMQSPSFIVELLRGLQELEQRTDIAPNLYTVLKLLDENKSFSESIQMQSLRERCKDIISGTFTSGWPVSSKSHELVMGLAQQNPARIPSDELQTYFHSLHDKAKLAKLFSSWQQTGILTPKELAFLRSEQKYVIASDSIWAYADALLNQIVDSDLKENLHTRLVGFCYELKASKQELSFQEFKQSLQTKVGAQTTLPNYSFLYEYLYAKTTQNYEPVRAAYASHLRNVVIADASIGKSKAERTAACRTISGTPVSTVRFEDNTLVVLARASEKYGPTNPGDILDQLSAQAFDTVEQVHLPLDPDADRQLLFVLKLLQKEQNRVSFDQSQIEHAVLLHQVAQAIGRTEEAVVVDTEQVTDEFYNFLDAASTGNLTSTAAENIVARYLYSIREGIHNGAKTEALKIPTEKIQTSVWNEIGASKQTTVQTFFENAQRHTDSPERAFIQNLVSKVFDPVKNGVSRHVREEVFQLLAGFIEQSGLKPDEVLAEVVARKYTDCKNLFTVEHGFGGGRDSHKGLLAHIGTTHALPGTAIVNQSYMGAEGNNSRVIQGKVVKCARQPGTTRPDFFDLAVWAQSSSMKLGAPAFYAVAKYGHSMGGMVKLYEKMIAQALNEFHNDFYYATMPVSANNDVVVTHAKIFENILKHDHLYDSLLTSGFVQRAIRRCGISKSGKSAHEIFIELAHATATGHMNEDVKNHISLLKFDAETMLVRAFAPPAALITSVVSNPETASLFTREFLVLLGKAGINSIVLKQLIQNSDTFVRAQHNWELTTNLDSFVSHCQQILSHAKTLSEREQSLLGLESNNLEVLLATEDVILKFVFFIALYEPLLKCVKIARKNGRKPATHYAQVDQQNVGPIAETIYKNMLTRSRKRSGAEPPPPPLQPLNNPNHAKTNRQNGTPVHESQRDQTQHHS